MRATDPAHSQAPPRAIRSRVFTGLLALLPTAAYGQSQERPKTLLEQAEARAEFVLGAPAGEATSAASERDAPAGRASWALDLPLEDAVAAPLEVGDPSDQRLTELWMLRSWTLSPDSGGTPDDSITALDGHSARAALDPLRARTERWATGLFSRDAELLTPLAPGRELLSWELTDRFTLSGVGGSRVWDYREREFVLSAEAGWRLSARAGLHFGAELLQASTTNMSPDVSGESVFARFQLRF